MPKMIATVASESSSSSSVPTAGRPGLVCGLISGFVVVGAGAAAASSSSGSTTTRRGRQSVPPPDPGRPSRPPRRSSTSARWGRDLLARLGILGCAEADPRTVEPVGRDGRVAPSGDAQHPLRGGPRWAQPSLFALDLAFARRMRLEASARNVHRELHRDGRRLGVVALIRDADDDRGECSRLPFAGLERDVGDRSSRNGHGDQGDTEEQPA